MYSISKYIFLFATLVLNTSCLINFNWFPLKKQTEANVGLHMQCVLPSHFDYNWNVPTNSNKTSHYLTSWKSVQLFSRSYIFTGRAKLTDAFLHLPLQTLPVLFFEMCVFQWILLGKYNISYYTNVPKCFLQQLVSMNSAAVYIQCYLCIQFHFIGTSQI